MYFKFCKLTFYNKKKYCFKCSTIFTWLNNAGCFKCPILFLHSMIYLPSIMRSIWKLTTTHTTTKFNSWSESCEVWIHVLQNVLSQKVILLSLVKVSSRRNRGQQILYHIWHNKTSLYIKVPTNAHIIFQHSSVKTSCKVNGLRQYKCITLCLNKSKMDLCKECFKVYKFHFMDYGFFFQDKLLPFSCKCTNRMFLSLLALTRDIALSFFYDEHWKK